MNNQQEEIWKTIEEYPNYLVGNLGNVISLNFSRTNTARFLTPGINGHGYLITSFYKDKKVKSHSIHSIVAKAFIPNPLNNPVVNHIDGNKLNNNANNLEWCTVKENVVHGFTTGLSKGKINRLDQSQSVLQYSLNDVFIKEYPSIRQAVRETKIAMPSIINCCKGFSHNKGKIHKCNTAGGFVWKYKTTHQIESLIIETKN